jgi:GntR family transcriptional regulator
MASLTWHNQQPIYLQLKDRLVAMILEDKLKAGDSLPSVRQIAAEYRVNPLTVSKAYQLLLAAEVVEKRRGLGMFVLADGGQKLLKLERQRFLMQQWPLIVQQIKRLKLDKDDLLATLEMPAKASKEENNHV